MKTGKSLGREKNKERKDSMELFVFSRRTAWISKTLQVLWQK